MGVTEGHMGNVTGRHHSWTAQEIAIASDENFSVHEMAKRIGRTYQAVKDFRRDNRISERRADHGPRKSDQVLAATLCACASLDGDHESWCPSDGPE